MRKDVPMQVSSYLVKEMDEIRSIIFPCHLAKNAEQRFSNGGKIAALFTYCAYRKFVTGFHRDNADSELQLVSP